MITFKLTRKGRRRPEVDDNGNPSASLYDTTEGKILAVHWCSCHDWWPYGPEALKKALRDGVVDKIICCFPKLAKRRYPELAEYIIGDWEGVTETGEGCGEPWCSGCQGTLTLEVSESAEATMKHELMTILGIDHMGGRVPFYEEEEEKKAA